MRLAGRSLGSDVTSVRQCRDAGTPPRTGGWQREWPRKTLVPHLVWTCLHASGPIRKYLAAAPARALAVVRPAMVARGSAGVRNALVPIGRWCHAGKTSPLRRVRGDHRQGLTMAAPTGRAAGSPGNRRQNDRAARRRHREPCGSRRTSYRRAVRQRPVRRRRPIWRTSPCRHAKLR
jgi:hypothetical protein